MLPLSDSDLISLVLLNNDHYAFKKLINKHQSDVRLLLRRLTTGDNMLADDLAQEVFIRVYRHLKTYQNNAKFSTWLYRIFCNVFIGHRNKSKESVSFEQVYNENELV